MRIISGNASSLRLEVPPSLTRPTTDRVREAMFSSLGFTVIDARVLDLFAGSGALGLEALSRGAESAVFVDKQPPSEKAIRANLKTCNLDGGEIVRRDVFRYLDDSPPNRFDLVFADPPYARDDRTATMLHRVLLHPGLPASLAPEGVFVLESFSSAPLPESPFWRITKEKTYGETRVSFLASKR